MTDEQYNGIIEAIENKDKRCIEYNITLSKNEGEVGVEDHNLTSNGTEYSDRYWNISKYIRVSKNEYTTILNNYTANQVSYCLYTLQKELISCEKYNGRNEILINPNQDGYIRLSYRKQFNGDSLNFTGNYCYNIIEEQNTKLETITNTIPFIIGLLIVAVLLLRRNGYR